MNKQIVRFCEFPPAVFADEFLLCPEKVGIVPK
jgi:hypothetical protein